MNPLKRAYEKALSLGKTPAEVAVQAPPLDLSRVRTASQFELLRDYRVEKGTLVAEEFRSLRTILMTLFERRHRARYVFSSCHHGEGKTACVLNLGLMLARQDRLSIALVEGDLRRPKLALGLGFRPEAGIDNVVAGDAEIEDVMLKSPEGNLYLLPARRGHSDAAEIVGSERMDEIVRRMCATFDMVLIDSTPLLSTSEPIILGGLVDGVILVVKAGDTQRESLQHARATVEQAGIPIQGAILSHVKNVLPRFLYRYQYYHDYYYEAYGQVNHDEED